MWNKSKHLKAFFDHFKKIVVSYDAVETVTGHATLDSLDELFNALRVLKANPCLGRDALLRELFGNARQPAYEGIERQELALNTLMEVSFLINCAGQPQSLASLELGHYATPWSGNMTMSAFVDTSFRAIYSSTSEQKGGNMHEYEGQVTASMIQKQAGLTIQPTDNLRNHLRLDRRNNVLQVFHHAGYLKQQLRLSKGMAGDMSIEKCLER